jgi:hypothetical protein
MAKNLLGQEIPKQSVEQQLTAVVPRYGSNKVELDSYKKLCDADNALIKELMGQASLPEFTAGGYKATRSVTEKESFDEVLLLAKLKKLKVKGVVKKKEYVDMDALENAIYHGQVDAATLADCQVKNEVVTLRIKAVKGKEA